MDASYEVIGYLAKFSGMVFILLLGTMLAGRYFNGRKEARAIAEESGV